MSLDLEKLTDVVEADVYAEIHKDVCGCLHWPDACKTFPNGALFSVTTYGVLEAGLPHIEKAVRAAIAERIERELVCCDIYARIDAADGNDSIAALRLSGDYHAICHWGGFAAAIARSGVTS